MWTGVYVKEHTCIWYQRFKTNLPDKTQSALVINYHDHSSKIRIFSFYTLEIRSDNHYFAKGSQNSFLTPSFPFSSLSLGMTSKIPTEDCAGTNVYFKFFNAFTELVFQLRKKKNNKKPIPQYSAHACWKHGFFLKLPGMWLLHFPGQHISMLCSPLHEEILLNT